MKTDMSALYAAALILHPGCRTRYIEVNWPKKWVKSTLEKVRKLWEDYRETTPLPTSSISILYDKRLHKPRELNMFDQIAQSLKQVSRPASQDEYEDYNSGELVELSTEASALAWWCHDIRRQRYPRLSYMAIDILSIPAMSDEPERVFSGARRTISWERGQLNPETVEITECLKHWKKSGILDKFLESEDE
jgi:hAT family protein